MKTKLHIVGLRYYSWSGRMAEIFATDAPQHDTWMGRTLFLQRDHPCVEDAQAVMAWTLTEPVGHVSKVDLPLVAGALEQGKRELLMVRIVGLDTRRRALVVEPVDELPDEPARCKPAAVPWTWDGPVMPLPRVWAQSDHFGRMMNLMVKGDIPYDDEVVRRYMQSTVADLSGDAYASRSLLAHTLLQSADSRLTEAGHELLAVMDHMGSNEQMAGWYTGIAATLRASSGVRSMAARYAEVDVQRVLAALRSFPFEIGREWLAGNTDLFARRLYYAQIPRTDILKLFTLIILYTSASRRMQPAPPQPAVGLNLGAPCQMSVGTLDNHGTVLSIDQPHIYSKS